nr:MAG TPA: hypothetical protein [Caudoviricetes sp.]
MQDFLKILYFLTSSAPKNIFSTYKKSSLEISRKPSSNQQSLNTKRTQKSDFSLIQHSYHSQKLPSHHQSTPVLSKYLKHSAPIRAVQNLPYLFLHSPLETK